MAKIFKTGSWFAEMLTNKIQSDFFLVEQVIGRGIIERKEKKLY